MSTNTASSLSPAEVAARDQADFRKFVRGIKLYLLFRDAKQYWTDLVNADATVGAVQGSDAKRSAVLDVFTTGSQAAGTRGFALRFPLVSVGEKLADRECQDNDLFAPWVTNDPEIEKNWKFGVAPAPLTHHFISPQGELDFRILDGTRNTLDGDGEGPVFGRHSCDDFDFSRASFCLSDSAADAFASTPHFGIEDAAKFTLGSVPRTELPYESLQNRNVTRGYLRKMWILYECVKGNDMSSFKSF